MPNEIKSYHVLFYPHLWCSSPKPSPSMFVISVEAFNEWKEQNPNEVIPPLYNNATYPTYDTAFYIAKDLIEQTSK